MPMGEDDARRVAVDGDAGDLKAPTATSGEEPAVNSPADRAGSVSAAAPVVVSDERQLDPRVIPLQRISGAIFAAFLAAGTMVGAMSAWVGTGGYLLALILFAGLWLVFNLFVLWHTQRWPAVEYRHTWYRVDERGIEIRRGVYWRVVINVPRSRVQHTDVSQGPLERRYGLGTLVIYTAGTDHAKVTLAGLDHAVALGIREHLMPERGTDAV